MSQASSEFDDSGSFDSADFGTSVTFEETPQADFSDPAAVAGGEMPQAPAAPTSRPKGFNIYSMILILSFLMMTTAAIVLLTYASRLSNL